MMGHVLKTKIDPAIEFTHVISNLVFPRKQKKTIVDTIVHRFLSLHNEPCIWAMTGDFKSSSKVRFHRFTVR